MRMCIAASLLLMALMPATAQPSDQARPLPQQRQNPASDEKAAETKKLVEAGRKRQDAENARTMKLWTRWTYAVCIGCSLGEPRHIRVVHTTPARVLAGIPAAQDDARERAMASRDRPLRRLHLRQIASYSSIHALAHEAAQGAPQHWRAA
ncbi:MAG: hypothetical protein INR70_05585 [Parafilimonas terrae]|jgi:hypothetical protein|nr:hypothetical protein [Parafilimonas terrae]